LLIGFLIAALGIMLKFMQLTTYTSWMVPLLVLGVPLFDMALVVMSRLRRGLAPSRSPGKDHSAHRLACLGFGETGAVVTVYLVAILFGILAVIVSLTSIFGAYLLAGTVLVCLALAVWRLENAPYERQEQRGLVDAGRRAQLAD
jgi:UDP-GlcNAc:undecaprenyl-phosphate GlcNAc-1-phosphate transferase